MTQVTAGCASTNFRNTCAQLFAPNSAAHAAYCWWMPPFKDLLQVAIWLGAFLGNTVEWRGERLRLRSDGTLVRN